MWYNDNMAEHTIITLDGETPVKLTPNGTHSGMDITIQNVSPSANVYLGANAQVSSENYGFRLKPDFAWSIELTGKDALYAVASAPDTKIAILRASLETGD
jgi:hypothetical protein